MKLRKRTVIAAVLVFLLSAAGAFYMMNVHQYKEKIQKMQFTELDLQKVEDGTYTGSCDTGMVSATVKVTVKDHEICGIDLIEHKNGRGTPAEVLLDEMVEKQSTDVDVVTGATSSSKVLRKAVEEALQCGLNDA